MKCANCINEFNICKATGNECNGGEELNCNFHTNEPNINEQILKKLETIVVEFLVENGGYSNGYYTFVDGIVREKEIHSLSWKTPKADKLKPEEIQYKGFELNNRLMAVVEFYKIGEAKIVAEDKDFGVFNTTVSYTSKRRVYIPYK